MPESQSAAWESSLRCRKFPLTELVILFWALVCAFFRLPDNLQFGLDLVGVASFTRSTNAAASIDRIMGSLMGRKYLVIELEVCDGGDQGIYSCRTQP